MIVAPLVFIIPYVKTIVQYNPFNNTFLGMRLLIYNDCVSSALILEDLQQNSEQLMCNWTRDIVSWYGFRSV